MKGQVYEVEGGYIVRFGRAISKRFRTVEQAERFLTGLRYETDRGTFDPRDYAADRPLLFQNMAKKYLEVKEKEVKKRSLSNLKNYTHRAIEAWGDMNVKAISYALIEDFLNAQAVSDKTRANMKSCPHDFFRWAKKREGIPMPEFPEVAFELGWRQIIDIETQQAIIGKVEELSAHINPKIGLAVRWLSTYISMRPGELLAIREGHINRREGFIVLPHPKV